MLNYKFGSIYLGFLTFEFKKKIELLDVYGFIRHKI